MPSPVYLLLGGLTWPVVKLAYRLRATGVEHVPEGGFVLAANHVSSFDPWPLGLPLFPKRHLRFMAKSELYWWPLGAIITAGGGFPVRRGRTDVRAIQTAVKLARAGEAVVMFPEGTRRSKGLRKRREARAHTGAARIALLAGVPLVPAAIVGTDRLSRFGPLRVRYGEPLDLADLSALEVKPAAAEATTRLMGRIAELETELKAEARTPR